MTSPLPDPLPKGEGTQDSSLKTQHSALDERRLLATADAAVDLTEAEQAPSGQIPLLYGVDDRPPLARELVYALQWVLVMFYAVVWGFAVVAVGLEFQGATLASYMSRVVLMIGVATLAQALIGHRMALMSGPSIIASLAILSAARSGGVEYALRSFDALIVAGLIVIVITLLGWYRYVEAVWSPLVLGSLLMMIGLAVAGRGIALVASAGFGWPFFAGIGLALLAGFLGIRGQRTLASLSIGLTIIAGYVVFIATGRFDWTLAQQMPVLATPSLFPFGIAPPPFELVVAMTMVTLFSSVNVYGTLQAYSHLVGTTLDPGRNRRARLVLGAVESGLTGALGVPGIVPYGENLGIVTLTRVASRSTIILAAGAFVLLSFFGTAAGVMAAMPRPLAGAILLGVAANVIGIGAGTWYRSPHFGPREQFIVSFAVFLSLGLFSLPEAGLAEVPQVIRTLITNPVVFVVLVVILLEQVVLRTGDESRVESHGSRVTGDG